jgi:hypothetical protein
MELLGGLAQLFYIGSSLVAIGYLLVPPRCNCPMVSINESHIYSSYCQSSTPLALTDSLSFDTCCFGYWLRIVITTTTLIGTLLGLGGLGVIVALKLTCLELNIFCTSFFLGHYLNICFAL